MAASCSTLGTNRLHLPPPFLPPARHRVAHRAGVDIGARNEGTGGGEVSIAGGTAGAGPCRATAPACSSLGAPAHPTSSESASTRRLECQLLRGRVKQEER